tara:strand:- start:74 stop:775 length:702 start_codon:yes stop_codon:yes gene_type:complete
MYTTQALNSRPLAGRSKTPCRYHDSMISRISGCLIEAREGHALLECDHVVYEILVPGCDIPYLNTRCGTTVVFHTLHYHESHGQGSSFVPRLVGFHNERDRAFFELFTTVKNIGYRKALRALQLPFDRVAAAIAGKDASLLTTLPEIGKRTAETIIAELSGKVDDFVEDIVASVAEDDATSSLINDTVAMLTALGESRAEAQSLAQRALAVEPEITTPDALLSAVFRLRETAH